MLWMRCCDACVCGRSGGVSCRCDLQRSCVRISQTTQKRSCGIEPRSARNQRRPSVFVIFGVFVLLQDVRMASPSGFEAVGRRRSVSVGVQNLLVEGLGVRGGGRDVGVAGRLVGSGGELQFIRCLEIGIAGRAVGGGIVLEVEEKGEHC